jgi:DNA invertase Pin-like site-specific DNA recombinase
LTARKEPTVQKFVAYYRVSTPKQGVSGLGLEAQQRAVAAYLETHGGELVAAYTEVETGTRKGNNRPQLAAALAATKRQKAKLIIAKLDRLARNVHFISGLMESGVDFLALDVPSANRMVMHILAAVAEEEARMISTRTTEALAAAKARGVKMGNPANLDHEARLRGAAATASKARKAYAAVLPEVKRLRGDGAGYRAIAQRLNEAGHVTMTGLPFNHMTVKRLLARG